MLAPMSDISAITGYAGQYTPSILKSITDELSITNDMYVIRNLTAPRKLWKYVANKGLRPVDTSVENTTKTQGSFKVRTLTPKVAMKLLKVIPEELRPTFLSEQLDPNAKEYPGGFAQYFWDEQSASINDELEHNVFDTVDPDSVSDFNPASVYNPGDRVKFTLNVNDGVEFFRCVTTTTAAQSPTTHPAKWVECNAECLVEGIGTLIKRERTAGNLAGNVINTGSITDTNALTKIDGDMWAGIPDKVKRSKGGVTFRMSYNVYNKRVKALRKVKDDGTYYTEAEIKELKNEILDSDGKGKIKPCVWMNESQLVIATVDNNLTMGINQAGDKDTFSKFVELLHGYKCILKLILSFQVQDLSVLYVNDQS
jgi:hypothetical protein